MITEHSPPRICYAFPISLSRSRLKVFSVGGGAFTSTYGGRWLVDALWQLKPAVYLSGKGKLACSCEQAGVVIEPGDYVIIAQGRLEARETMAKRYGALHVVEISPVKTGLPVIAVNNRSDWGRQRNYDGEAIVEAVTDNDYCIPDAILTALTTYHNRDGTPFVRLPDRNDVHKSQPEAKEWLLYNQPSTDGT